MINMSDEELMEKFGKGEKNVFAELYSRHKNSLYRYFTRQVNSIERAEELFQETWFRVINNKGSYAEKAKFTTWLYRIAHNLLIDEYRKKSLTLVTECDLEELSSSYTPELDGEKKQAISHCLTLLAPIQKEAFLLRHESGFEPSQICLIVDAKAETVKTRLRYAIKQLRECLSRKLGGNDE